MQPYGFSKKSNQLTRHHRWLPALSLAVGLVWAGSADAWQSQLPPIRPASPPQTNDLRNDHTGHQHDQHDQHDQDDHSHDHAGHQHVPNQQPNRIQRGNGQNNAQALPPVVRSITPPRIDNNGLRSIQGTAQSLPSVRPTMPRANDRFESNQMNESNQPIGNNRSLSQIQTQPPMELSGQARQPINQRPINQPIVDHALQPATYNAPINSPPVSAPPIENPTNINRSNQTTMIAAGILGELQLSEQEMQSLGQPMELLDMLANYHGSQRNQLIKQYWKTYASLAEYKFAIDELRWIQQIGQTRNESDRLTLDAALSAANDSIADSSLKLIKEQNALNRFISGTRSEILPVPSDTPLVKRYTTYFDRYAAKQSVPEKLKQINQSLPQQQILIGDRAATVQRCRNAVMEATRSVSQGQSVSSLLQTLDLCRKSYSEFIKTVIEYNENVADYALTIRPHDNAPEQIVAMLIPASPRGSLPAESDTRLGQSQMQSLPQGQGATANNPQYYQSGQGNPGIGNRGQGNVLPRTASLPQGQAGPGNYSPQDRNGLSSPLNNNSGTSFPGNGMRQPASQAPTLTPRGQPPNSFRR